MISYLQLIQAIKNQPNGILFYKFSDDTEDKLARLEDAGCIRSEWSFDDKMNAGKRYTVAPQSPEITQPNVIERVHVSFWQTGARAGKFSSGAYEVVPTEKQRDGFITIKLMDNKQLTVKTEFTKAVA